MVCVNPGRSDYAAVTNDPQISVALKKWRLISHSFYVSLKGLLQLCYMTSASWDPDWRNSFTQEHYQLFWQKEKGEVSAWRWQSLLFTFHWSKQVAWPYLKWWREESVAPGEGLCAVIRHRLQFSFPTGLTGRVSREPSRLPPSCCAMLPPSHIRLPSTCGVSAFCSVLLAWVFSLLRTLPNAAVSCRMPWLFPELWAPSFSVCSAKHCPECLD